MPEIVVPAALGHDWSREKAAAAIVRGRMEVIGPTTIDGLGQNLGLPETLIEEALLALEADGTVLRGRFTGASELEWCDRRLLSRIHRLTLEGLRRQIAPVPVEQFLRFLTRFQHLQSPTRLTSERGVLAVVEQLEGFEIPAGHWEKYVFPARVAEYSGNWLDHLTFGGQVVWGRLRSLGTTGSAANGSARPIKALTRSTPITLMLREHLDWLLPKDEAGSEPVAKLGSNARAAFEIFQRHGALFPSQLASLLQLVTAQVEDVLGELAAAGLITSDGFAALRSAIGTKAKQTRRGRRRRNALSAAPHAGRWTLLRSALLPTADDAQRIEQWCWLLLRRYGVVFRDLLANESAAPPWSELVRTYRRLEARGEIRGGRFVAGVAGEQYALPDVIPLLRSETDSADADPILLPATDPLNLTGRVLAGPRVPAVPGHMIAVTGGHVSPANVPTRLSALGFRQ
jgi:ATP-dependent Lhr-like helicase